MENHLENTVQFQKIVEPKNIESDLKEIWESLSEKNKTRASLFNLVVYSKLGHRTDYFRFILQRLVENYPCRILFISSDPDFSKEYLKTAISVVSPKGEAQIACDQIDIGVGGKSYEKIPFIVLPHLLPDLPTYLLWGEDPDPNNETFKSLKKLSNRVIFDSESAENLSLFADQLLMAHKESDIADLNWTRIQPIRELLVSQFSSKERLHSLQNAEEIAIDYYAEPSQFFTHLEVPSLYLISWLTSRLGWDYSKKKVTLTAKKGNYKDINPGAIINIYIRSGKEEFSFERDEQKSSQMTIHISSKDSCELPLKYHLGKDVRGLSLSKEVVTQGTSQHYLEMLQKLKEIKR